MYCAQQLVKSNWKSGGTDQPNNTAYAERGPKMKNSMSFSNRLMRPMEPTWQRPDGFIQNKKPKDKKPKHMKSHCDAQNLFLGVIGA